MIWSKDAEIYILLPNIQIGCVINECHSHTHCTHSCTALTNFIRSPHRMYSQCVYCTFDAHWSCSWYALAVWTKRQLYIRAAFDFVHGTHAQLASCTFSAWCSCTFLATTSMFSMIKRIAAIWGMGKNAWQKNCIAGCDLGFREVLRFAGIQLNNFITRFAGNTT